MSNTISYKSANLALKLRLSPSQEQKSYLDKTFGCVRFIYNYLLDSRNQFYENSIVPLRKQFDYYEKVQKLEGLQKSPKENKSEIKNLKAELEAIKKITNQEYKKYQEPKVSELTQQFPFLKEANGQGKANAVMNLRTAYSNFFSGKSEKPKFHSKKQKNSFKDSMMKQDFLDWNSKMVDLPKVGKIKFSHRNLPKWYRNRTKVCSYTCSRNPNGKYYITILFEVKLDFKEKIKASQIDESQVIGLDFDCDDMYVDSNGKSALKDFGFKKQKQENLSKLSHLQRQYARKIKGSKNKEGLRIKIASLEEHIANARLDWIEKESLRLTKENQLIGLEDLSIQGMMKGSKNAKNYQDIAWSTFVSKLKWKGKRYGCHIVKIDKFFASSQICSCCGFKNLDVQKFYLENWTCPECGQIHQRDFNAAKNIRSEAIRVLREAEENQEKSQEIEMSKDTGSVLQVNELVNLALACAS